ncbi:TetR/AcrR family transcriptional regulator [Paenibacillus lactis]|uniref:TetR/AcrR family transcriptional regulator n=1 Tax=Paenibacillus TaxID=44249 RepID=UPI00203B9F47|nr:TetR/AcrR family transcriptional regulator [Paenibacillus lactis]MCM3496900.1 TetR/AcrR family transcriptional regulator [Paenibacillus lactis]
MAEKDQDKTRVPQQQRSMETKQKIVAAAMKLFSEKGFHATNTKEIAKEANVAVGSVYSYYTDKMEIFKDALALFHERFTGILRGHGALQLNTSQNKRELIRDVIEIMIKAHEVDIGFHREMDIMALSYPEIKDMADKEMRFFYKFTARLLRSWQQETRIKDPDAAATVLILAAHGVVEAVAFGGMGISRERLIKESIDMLHSYLWPQEALQERQNEELGLSMEE